MLTQQENRWWSVKVQSFKSKEHFLRYAGIICNPLSGPSPIIPRFQPQKTNP
jgi:hypothetical protein